MASLPNLDKMTVPELTALIEEAQTKRREKMVEAKAGLIEEFRAKAAQLGLTLEDVLAAPSAPSPKSAKAAGSSLPAKYRGPNGEEWSGRGRLPRWLQAAEATGKSRDDFKA